MKIGVINYGVGNLGSVLRTLEMLSSDVISINHPSDVKSADCFILPGVGNFTDCKQLLDKNGWTNALSDEVLVHKKPILGICLGMQLLADLGMEGANNLDGTKGLGFIPGKVRSLTDIECRLRIPHVGWNSINIKSECPLLTGIPSNTDFYFVHSYVFIAKYAENVIATTTHDVEITAIINHGNIWGTQFHPEKSSKAGLQVIRNFIEYSKC